MTWDRHTYHSPSKGSRVCMTRCTCHNPIEIVEFSHVFAQIVRKQMARRTPGNNQGCRYIDHLDMSHWGCRKCHHRRHTHCPDFHSSTSVERPCGQKSPTFCCSPNYNIILQKIQEMIPLSSNLLPLSSNETLRSVQIFGPLTSPFHDARTCWVGHRPLAGSHVPGASNVSGGQTMVEVWYLCKWIPKTSQVIQDGPLQVIMGVM